MGCAFSARIPGSPNIPVPQPQLGPCGGIVVDCGSGHASIFWYACGDDGRAKQMRRSRLTPNDAQFKLVDALATATKEMEANIDSMCTLIQSEIDEATSAKVDLQAPSMLIIGATGGMREALATGTVSRAAIGAVQQRLEASFGSTIGRVRFTCLSGEQEATWELRAAQELWGGQAERMFGAAPKASARELGLLSGGGQSMQLGVPGQPPCSWPFSTWHAALNNDEPGSDAWRQSAAWQEWEAKLLVDVDYEFSVTRKRKRIHGRFVLISMNQVAAAAAGFVEEAVSAEEAVAKLRDALRRFVAAEGEEVAAFLEARKHYKYNVARVTAMHLCRLAHVLERLFEPQARLFAPDPKMYDLHCEWPLGAFMEELRTPLPPAPSTPTRVHRVSYSGKV